MLIVDDSPIVSNILAKAVSGATDMEVVGRAQDPYEAREAILKHDPDVLVLDIIMPRMNGLAFLKRLDQYFPTPVVIVSTIAQKGSKIALQARQYGAMEVIDKNDLELYKGMDIVRAELIPKTGVCT